MNFKQFLQTKIGLFLFWTLYPVGIFIGSQYLIQFVMFFVAQYFNDPQAIVTSSIFNAIYNVLFFGIIFVFIYNVPKKYLGFELNKSDIGIAKELGWRDIGIGVIGFFVSMYAAGLLLEIAKNFLSSFNPNQAQMLGFSGLVQPYEFVIAFICLAIIPPFVEEFIFRGVLYSEFRKIGVIFSIIFTSLLFGLAHGQLNVGIVTFVMSVIMCIMRERITDSIWSGMVLHFLKNSIAFAVLYILPNFLL